MAGVDKWQFFNKVEKELEKEKYVNAMCFVI